MWSFQQFTRARLTALVVAMAGMLTGCGPSGDTPDDDTVPEVQVVTVQPSPFVQSVELPGRITPLRAAQVRARVPGIVTKRHFVEGADVQAGDVLFSIDDAPYRTAVARAEAHAAQAEAAVMEARNVVNRYKPLVAIGAISAQAADTAQADYRKAVANRQAAHAEVVAAKLDLDYATVKAPISGRIGRAYVTEGALVGQGETTPLADIVQLDAVYADIHQSAAEWATIRAHARPAITVTWEGAPTTLSGTLLFADVTVNPTTGQVLLRGKFPNAEGLLLPGMYVRVQLPQRRHEDAILVPQRAVQLDSGRASVWIVDIEGKLQARDIVLGAMTDRRWHVISGLHPSDRVVIDGTQHASAGARPARVVDVSSTDSV